MTFKQSIKQLLPLFPGTRKHKKKAETEISLPSVSKLPTHAESLSLEDGKQELQSVSSPNAPVLPGARTNPFNSPESITSTPTKSDIDICSSPHFVENAFASARAFLSSSLDSASPCSSSFAANSFVQSNPIMHSNRTGEVEKLHWGTYHPQNGCAVVATEAFPNVFLSFVFRNNKTTADAVIQTGNLKNADTMLVIFILEKNGLALVVSDDNENKETQSKETTQPTTTLSAIANPENTPTKSNSSIGTKLSHLTSIQQQQEWLRDARFSISDGENKATETTTQLTIISVVNTPEAALPKSNYTSCTKVFHAVNLKQQDKPLRNVESSASDDESKATKRTTDDTTHRGIKLGSYWPYRRTTTTL